MARLKNYIKLEIHDIPATKGIQGLSTDGLKEEAQRIMALIKPGDFLVLLDDKGSEFDSLKWAEWLNKRFVSLSSDLIFVAGGAYGFHASLRDRANASLSLSKMTFTHQMVRVIFLEQLYRAMTILRNEPYHHS